jgi:hypothetical protein
MRDDDGWPGTAGGSLFKTVVKCRDDIRPPSLQQMLPVPEYFARWMEENVT